MEQGVEIQRRFTEEKNPLKGVELDTRSSTIRNPDGTVLYEIEEVTVPNNWTQVSTDILAQKYFRKTGVPQPDGSTGTETSIIQVAHRLAGCWRHWGEKHGYFASKEDAQIFYDEMKFMIVNQMAAPNSPQWFNTGLAWAYDIKGGAQGHWYTDPVTEELKQSEDAYSRPAPHACFIQSVKDDLVNPGGIFDLVTREARIFKYGAGTGTNFSSLRGEGEPLSGGGKSSGLMSWLKINDRAAGAIKSGGTTRRAAKMVCLDMDHPEIEQFIDWKMIEEQKVADLVTGSKNVHDGLTGIIEAAKSNPDLENNKKLRTAVKKAITLNIPMGVISRTLQMAQMGITNVPLQIYDTHFEGEAYYTVSGQNSNNSVRIPNKFFEALKNYTDWDLIQRTDGKVMRSVPAKKLWEKIKLAAWACADPGVQFDTTINEWHTCPAHGRINASNPCSEYLYLDDTACNLASINLGKFLNDDNTFDIEGYKHAIKLWTMVLEISVLMAQFPSKEIADLSYKTRTLGLGYANLGTVLMRLGIPYDSDKGRAIAGALTAVMCGEAYATSALMAKDHGPFKYYAKNKDNMLRIIRNHRRAAYNADSDEYEGLTISPVGIDEKECPEKLLEAAKECWDRALELGEEYGYRNAQVTVLAPTGTIGLVMDCDTTGVEPDFALVKFKKLAGGGYMKIINQSVPKALKTLGYTEKEVDKIVKYTVGHGTFQGCPHINKDSLKEKGFTDKAIANVESGLASAFELAFVFNKFTIGETLLNQLGFSEEQLNYPGLNILEELGFTPEQIEEANLYVCGHMTVEGAPGLKDKHLPVFDCASKCGKLGTRALSWKGHIKMMASVQPFLSGAISKTINMPKEATIDEIGEAYKLSWSLMLKANALYRDGCKLSQPLNATSNDLDAELLQLSTADDVDETVGPAELHYSVAEMVSHPTRRTGFVQEAHVGGHKVIVKASEHEGVLSDVQIDMYKEGSSYRCLVNAFANAVSTGLKHGVPLQAYVEEFTFTKFEPAGQVVGDPKIKQATSVVDYVFRLLGSEYLDRQDLVHVQDTERIKTHQTVLTNQGNTILQAKNQGFTGEECSTCGSMKVKQNGTCTVCLDCGTTSGCS